VIRPRSELISSGGSASRRRVAISYGLICHGLFAAAVGTMILAMFFGLGRSWGPFRSPECWFANGLLLLQFPLMHSFLLARPGQRALRRLAPARYAEELATTSYVIVASIQVILLFALWSPSGTVWWRATGTARLAISCTYAGTWLLLLKSLMDAGIALQTGLLGWRAVLHDERPVYPKMPISGLFRLCRQPIYLSFALTMWTVPTWTPDQLVLALGLTAYCLVGPLFKERRFRRLFGKEFELFACEVPYWLPWPRPRSQPALRSDTTSEDDPGPYGDHAEEWWSGKHRWLRMLRNLVRPRLRFFATAIGDWRGKTVLDLGCGGGFMAEALAALGAAVIGIDPCETAVATARKHAVANGLRIDYCVGAGEDIPVASGSVDCVVCVDVLEHVELLDRVLEEARRTLKPGGLFLFDTINRTRLASLVFVTLAERILRIVPQGMHDPAKFIRPSELRTKLLRLGFDLGPFVGLGPCGLDRRLDFTFGPLPTTAMSYLGYARAPSR